MGRKLISVLIVFFIFVFASCTSTDSVDENVTESSFKFEVADDYLYEENQIVEQENLDVPVHEPISDGSNLQEVGTDIDTEVVSTESIETTAVSLSLDTSLDEIQDEFSAIIENPKRSRDYLESAVEKLDLMFAPADDIVLDGLEWDEMSVVSKLDNGNIYLGQAAAVNNIIPDGIGILIFPDERIYIGNFENSKRNGNGIMIWDTKEKFIGQWVEDNISGVGISYLSSNEIWRGFFLVGTFWRGIDRIEKNGNVYYIEYVSGISTGRVFIVYSNGAYYLGDYNSLGSLSGTGVMLYPNGDIYSGRFRAGLKSGEGVYIYASGGELNGSWLNDSYRGKFKI